MPNKESRLSDAELDWINATFAGNTFALKALRKIFLYEVEPDMPIGMARDMWTTLDLSQLSREDRLRAVEVRQDLIKQIEGGLTVLYKLAGETRETPEQTKKRLEKDSAK